MKHDTAKAKCMSNVKHRENLFQELAHNGTFPHHVAKLHIFKTKQKITGMSVEQCKMMS